MNVLIASSDGILKQMNAECIKEGIKVHLVFQKPFDGVAYSFGHYDNPLCRYISGPDSSLAYSKSTNYTFLIPADDCGTIRNGGGATQKAKGEINSRRTRNSEGSNLTWEDRKSSSRTNDAINSNDVYIENLLLIQQDTSIQEEGDLAQKIRCVWQNEISKPLSASLPFYKGSRNKPPKFIPPIRNTYAGLNNNNNNNVNNSTFPGSSNRMRYQSGQVENVPYYSYRKKWSRSVKTGENLEEEPETILALPLQSLSNSSPKATSHQRLVDITFLMLVISYFYIV